MTWLLAYGRGVSVVVGCAALGGASLADALPRLPSGLSPVLLEEFIEVKPDGLFTYARFRFVEPAIGAEGAPDYEVLAEDFLALCQGYALERLEGSDEKVDRVVISYSDRPIEFGESDPDVTQYFEQFSIENGNCLWEQF